MDIFWHILLGMADLCKFASEKMRKYGVLMRMATRWT